MARDSRSAELRAQIEASKQQQNELERQADELRRQADELGRRAGLCAEQRDLEGRLTLAVATEARTAAFHAGGGSLLLGDGITDDTLLPPPPPSHQPALQRQVRRALAPLLQHSALSG